MKNLDKYLETSIEASIKAGAAIMDVYNGKINVKYKEDKSPLTEADRQANEIINSFLNKTGIPIISEENKQIAYEERKNWKYCWIVDPVDGTKEFIKKNGEFTVNIALVENNKPIAGVIFVPATRELYLGNVNVKKSFRAELNNLDYNVNTIKKHLKSIQPNRTLNRKRVVGSRSHMNDKTKTYIENLKESGENVTIVNKGSSLKFCLLADGRAEIYPRFAPTMEWDTAAGQAICNAVGVEVISQETLLPLRYNKRNLLNPEFIARV